MARVPRRARLDGRGARCPVGALWGAQTQRAVENFPISGRPVERAGSSGRSRSIKGVAARVNGGLDVVPKVDRPTAIAIAGAADEVVDGAWHDQFPVDVVPDRLGHVVEHERQRGDRAAGDRRGSARPVHPNDHVNASQSSNDVFPSAMHLAAVRASSRRAGARAGAAGASAAPKQREFAPGREGGPHAPDGRHAGDPRPGVRRLRVAGRGRRSSASMTRCPGWASCRSAAPRSAPASTRRSGFAREVIARLAHATGPAAHRGARPLRGAGRPRRARRGERTAARARGRA